MKFRCVGKRVLVEVLPHQTESKGGILLPDAVQGERPNRGRVMALGDDGPFHLGDIVCFGKYAGIKIRDLDGNERLNLQHDEIIGFEVSE